MMKVLKEIKKEYIGFNIHDWRNVKVVATNDVFLAPLVLVLLGVAQMIYGITDKLTNLPFGELTL